VQDYLEGIAEEFGLQRHIRFNTRLVRAQWVEAKQRWDAIVKSSGSEETIEGDFLVSAIGQLSDPSVPDIPGLTDFRGLVFHSKHWPDGVQLQGQRLAVIGTGATSMQLVPTVADTVAEVTVFQRTAQWARPIPGYSDPIPEGAKWLLEHVPFYAQWFRFNMLWRRAVGPSPAGSRLGS
jgi:4-hydroxyacetophenone monooxygenase